MKKIKILFIALILVIMSMLTFAACDISLVPDDLDMQQLLDEYIKDLNLRDILSEEELKSIIDDYLKDKDLGEYIDIEELLRNKNLWDYVDAETLIRDPRFKEVFNKLLQDEDEETREVLRGIFKEFLKEENLWEYLAEDEEQFKQVITELLQGENGAEILEDWLSNEEVRQSLFDLLKNDDNFKQMLIDMFEKDDDFKQILIDILKSEDGAEILEYWLAENSESFKKLLEEILAEMLFDENGQLVGLEELLNGDEFRNLLKELLAETLFDEDGQLVGLEELLNGDEFRNLLKELLAETLFDEDGQLVGLEELLKSEDFKNLLKETLTEMIENGQIVDLEELLNDEDFKNLLKELLIEMIEEGDLDIEELLEDEAIKQILTEIVKDALKDGDLLELIGQEQMKEMFLTLLEEDAEFKQAVIDALKDDILAMIADGADINQLLTDKNFIDAALANEAIRETIIKGIVSGGFFDDVLKEYVRANS